MTTLSATKNKLVRYKGSESYMFTHECQKCDKWGSFGYNVDLRKDKSGQWYCREHRPDKQESLF